MEHTNTVYQVGNATITKIPELVLDAVPPSFLYPGSDEAVAAKEGHKLGAASYDHRPACCKLASMRGWYAPRPG